MKINEIIIESSDYRTMGKSNYKQPEKVDTSKRNFLRKGAALAGAAGAGAIATKMFGNNDSDSSTQKPANDRPAQNAQPANTPKQGTPVEFDPSFSQTRLRHEGYLRKGDPLYGKNLPVTQGGNGNYYYIQPGPFGYAEWQTNSEMTTAFVVSDSGIVGEVTVENKTGKIRFGHDGEFKLYPDDSVTKTLGNAIYSLGKF